MRGPFSRLLGFTMLLVIMQTAPPTSAGQHLKKPEDAQQGQNRESPKSNPASNPIVTQDTLHGQPAEVKGQAQENSAAYDPHKWLDWLNGLSTAVIALFAVITGIAVIRQVKTARRTERAWMVSFEPEMLFHGATSNVFYKCKVTNVGRTPSRIIETGIGFGATTSLSQLPLPPAYAERIKYNRIVVAPNDFITMHGQLSPQFSSDNQRAVQSGELFLYAYGFVRYLDVFGRGERDIRETRFCHCSDTRLSRDYANGYPPRPCIEAPSEYHRAT